MALWRRLQQTLSRLTKETQPTKPVPLSKTDINALTMLLCKYIYSLSSILEARCNQLTIAAPLRMREVLPQSFCWAMYWNQTQTRLRSAWWLVRMTALDILLRIWVLAIVAAKSPLSSCFHEGLIGTLKGNYYHAPGLFKWHMVWCLISSLTSELQLVLCKGVCKLSEVIVSTPTLDKHHSSMPKLNRCT